MTVSAIGGVSPSALSNLAGAISGGQSADATGATQGGTGTGFADVLSQGLQHLQDTQADADQLGVQAATGTLSDVHDYVIAATRAELTTELTVTMRNKALDAFNEIMRMQG